jgi:hypothetical protein
MRDKVGGTREKVGGTREEVGGTRDQGISVYTVKTIAKDSPLGTAHAYFKVRVMFKQMQRTFFMAFVDVIIYQNDQEEILYKNLA